MKNFEHIDATSVKRAAKLLRDSNGKARAIAGGTDLLGAFKDRILPEYPETIINLKSIPGLDYVKQDGRTLKIGALASLTSVAESPAVKARYPMLAEAARSVATPQVRNMATIGGNLCQENRCWYYRYPHDIGGRIFCYLKGGKSCYALTGENQYHSIFGGRRVAPTPCTQACRGSIDIAGYLGFIRQGKLAEATFTLLASNPLPAITGRVCPHWCERDCNRQDFDQAVSIRGIERRLGDYILEHATDIVRPPQTDSGKKVAVVGSGPAGLSAAFYLRMAGHAVTVFDQMPEPGGMLTYGIPAYRLPKDTVRLTIELFKLAGVKFKLNVAVGKEIRLEDLRRDFDAVFLATGMWQPRVLGIEGEDLAGSGLEFLRNTAGGGDNTVRGNRVLVVGGGGVALDAAITARRLGAGEVTLACLECRREMPADASEIAQAEEEGVKLTPSWGPSRVLASGGKVTGMELVSCTSVFDNEGRFSPAYDACVKTIVHADVILMAVGQAADLSYLGDQPDLKTVRGLVVADKMTQETSLPGIFAGGEVTTGPASVIEAVAAGRRAAAAINECLGGPGVAQASLPVSAQSSTGLLKFNRSCLRNSNRVEVDKLPLSQRSLDKEDSLGFNCAGMEAETNRCFNCGCVAVSPSDTAVVLMALGARVKITGPEGSRTVPVEELFPASGEGLRPEEVLTEIQVPEPPAGSKQIFEKFRIRKAVDFPIVSLAMVLVMKKDICKDASIVLGAVAPVPLRARAAELILKGRTLDESSAAAAADAALDGVLPLAKNEYKVQIARTLVRRALTGGLPPAV